MTKTAYIPNATPWTLLVEVITYGNPDDPPCVSEYALVGWKIDEEGEASPVALGEPDKAGSVMVERDLWAHCLLALRDPLTDTYRRIEGGGECTMEDLMQWGREGMKWARSDYEAEVSRRSAA